MKRGLRFLLCIVLSVPAAAWPWGAEGHRLVAQYAYQRLTAEVRAEAMRLLALEPGASLESVSTWADETRNVGTAAWHYINVGRSDACVIGARPVCIQGGCATGALDAQLAILKSRTASDAERLQALKWVVHLVADLHQPLHAGFGDDRGGNSYQVQAFGRGSNLHSAWDSGLIRNWPGGLEALSAEVATAPADAGAMNPADWAAESCRVASTAGFYPESRVVDNQYLALARPALAARLALAGKRLAVVLNSTLGSH